MCLSVCEISSYTHTHTHTHTHSKLVVLEGCFVGLKARVCESGQVLLLTVRDLSVVWADGVERTKWVAAGV